ncbi:MAG: hypothetical protein AAFN18_12895 [Cyanobacteria bacterium J06554_6]
MDLTPIEFYESIRQIGVSGDSTLEHALNSTSGVDEVIASLNCTQEATEAATKAFQDSIELFQKHFGGVVINDDLKATEELVVTPEQGSELEISTEKSKPFSFPEELSRVLPEDYVGNLAALCARRQRQGKSSGEIWRELSRQVIVLLWTHYVRVRIENLFMPRGHHEIDD